MLVLIFQRRIRFSPVLQSKNIMNTGSLPSSLSFHCLICRAVHSYSVLCPVVLTGTNPVYELAECPNCHTRFLVPLPTEEDLNRFYSPDYYGADWYKQEGKGRMFGRFLLSSRAKGKFLDVGCSLGFFLHGVHQSSGWQVHGVEISPDAVAWAREKLSLDIRCGELASVGYPDQFFDYIHVRNVLEHVRNPLAFLQECRRILRPGGHLDLSVPNGAVDSANLLNYFKDERKAPRSKDGHLYFFSQDSLHFLFQKSKFKVVTVHTFGIRRGLRALGWYPQKPAWKKPYHAQSMPPIQREINIPPLPKRLPFYDAYRFWQARIKMIPGLRKFGLDFEIILRAD
jgi:SAM-dependent methyltransferase